MKCAHLQEKLTAFVDAELSSAEYNEVKDHLKECPECRNLMEQEAALKELIKSKLPFSPAAGELRTRILDGLAVKKKGLSLWRPRQVMINFRPDVAFAIAAVFCAVFLGIYMQGNLQYRSDGQLNSPQAAFKKVASISWTDCDLKMDESGNVILKGELICIGCESTHNFNIPVDCAKYGHQMVLKTDYGLYVSFTPNKQCEILMKEKELAGLHVEVVGKLIPSGNYMNIVKYNKIA